MIDTWPLYDPEENSRLEKDQPNLGKSYPASLQYPSLEPSKEDRKDNPEKIAA